MNTVFVVLFVILFVLIILIPYKEQYEDASLYTNNIKCTDYVKKLYPDFYQAKILRNKQLEDTLSDMNTAFVKTPDVAGGERYNIVGCMFPDEKFPKYALGEDCSLNKYTLSRSLDTTENGCLYKFKDVSNEFSDVLQDAYNVQNDHSPNSKWVLYQAKRLADAKSNTVNSIQTLNNTTANYNSVVAQKNAKDNVQYIQNQQLASLQNQINDIMKTASSDEISFMHPDGRQWKFDTKNNCMRLNYGIGSVFKINAIDDRFVYLLNITNNMCVRHADYLIRNNQYNPNDTAFHWIFIKNTVNTYYIMNMYRGGYMIGYDPSSDTLLIVPSNDKRVIAWKTSSVIPSKYVR